MVTDPCDYSALIKLLLSLKQFPDSLGETRLTPEEAAKINKLGFEAAPGLWRAPPLPPDLTRDNPLLEPLSSGWDHRSREQITTSTVNNRAEQRGMPILVPARLATEGPGVHAGSHQYRQAQSSPPLRRRQADPRLVALVASKIKLALQRSGGQMTKRRLQMRFWRYGAAVFNEALRYLLDRGMIQLKAA